MGRGADGGEIVAGPDGGAVAYDGTQFQITGAAGPLPRRPDRHPDLRHRRHVHLHPHGRDEFRPGRVGRRGRWRRWLCDYKRQRKSPWVAPGNGGGYATKRITASFSGVTVTVGAKGDRPHGWGEQWDRGRDDQLRRLALRDRWRGRHCGTRSRRAGGRHCPRGRCRGRPGSNWCSQRLGWPGRPVYRSEHLTGRGWRWRGPSFFGGGATGCQYRHRYPWKSRASTPGAGGSGGNNAASQGAPRAGGDGADGYVIVWEFG